ncbi:MAG: arsenic-transporting ATPase [Micrococcales bacterium]|nr:arsenic-transporting ATPase [Micrococcales bacterium]
MSDTRVLLFTGKGGVGKSTLCSASAVSAAELGMRTLVISTDPAHSVADVFGIDADGSGPLPVLDRLDVLQLDSRMLLERSWRSVQEYLLKVLDSAGVGNVAAEELTVLPGAEEVLALLEVRNYVRSGEYDLVALDCAPTAETLRLLSLPEALDWYMRKIWPVERRVVTALRAPLSKTTGVPMPGSEVLDAVERLHDDLAEVKAVLTAPQSTVRLVFTPDAVVLAEARRTLTSLSLFGYRVDAAIANRIFPAGSDDWRSGWAEAQAERLQQARQDMAPLPVLTAPYRASEPVGATELRELADQVYPEGDPLGIAEAEPPLKLERLGEQIVVVLRLPLAVKGDVDLAERNSELIVTVGGYRRVLALPSALLRHRVVGAGLADGMLRVRFLPRDLD